MEMCRSTLETANTNITKLFEAGYAEDKITCILSRQYQRPGIGELIGLDPAVISGMLDSLKTEDVQSPLNFLEGIGFQHLYERLLDRHINLMEIYSVVTASAPLSGRKT